MVLLTEIIRAGVGDYIFIILIIIVSIVQAINKQRKKERMNQMNNHDRDTNRQEERRQRREVYHPMDEEQEDPFGRMFDRMEEIFDPVQYPSPEPEPREESVSKIGKPEIDEKRVQEILNKSREQKMPGDITSPSVYHQEKKEPLRKSIRRDFDPKKAIIYSEIIHRKY